LIVIEKIVHKAKELELNHSECAKVLIHAKMFTNIERRMIFLKEDSSDKKFRIQKY